MRKTIFALSLVLLVTVTNSYALSSPYSINADSIYSHISVLADDSLEGREVGEIGEWKAAQYITSVFEKAGLQPAGDNGSYFQQFDFVKRIDLGKNNRLTLNGEALQLNTEFEPMRQSASTTFEFDGIVNVGYGIKIPERDGDHNDYDGLDVEGKAVLISRYSPAQKDSTDLDLDRYAGLTDKIQTALDHKAAGVFFITPEDKEDTLPRFLPSYVNFKDIPIIFLRRTALTRLGLSLSSPEITAVLGETDLIKTRDTGYNVIARIPGATDTTVIIGAHYDHLGWGTSSSLYRGEEKMIHNGADDNASGVAAMLELARHYSPARQSLKHSLLFVAFSGEEAGVLGSSHFADNMTIDSSLVRMMVNIDMIGRLKDHDNGVAIMGTGTCTEFTDYFDSLKVDDIKLALKQSGTGPSDHTPFYNHKIPSLTYFTGPHGDYHKPSDDIDLIDFEGIARVAQLARDLIDHFESTEGQLTFQKTKDPDAGKRRANFSVTLGIMPDHVAEVKGLKIAGVMPERPGEKGGLLEGDIIIKMGDIDIGDIYDYMGALGKFRKGDSIIVVVNRAADTLSLPIEF